MEPPSAPDSLGQTGGGVADTGGTDPASGGAAASGGSTNASGGVTTIPPIYNDGGPCDSGLCDGGLDDDDSGLTSAP